MKKNYNLLLFLSFLTFLLNASYAQQKIEQWNRFEVTFTHTYAGNNFKDVNLTASFVGQDTSFIVSGFYDGNNTFKIRFMPPQIGTWSYSTSSNIHELNNQRGSFACVKASGINHGMVKVSDTYNFKYVDGKRYYPFGTTAYAWINMDQGLQEITLNTLKNSGFNKVRMCVFPKDYNLVKEEPEIYPYQIKEAKKDVSGKEIKVWDFDQFNPAFFQHLEK
ncbi:MAG: DUF5060 domain-containing protein, partial [Ignavibacteria bacterium]|nr:DUF5060 domain-containing protein [Ignavibacteria bacterium]